MKLQKELAYEKTVIFVVSTTGQGDNPDAMKVFFLLLVFFFFVEFTLVYNYIFLVQMFVGVLEIFVTKEFKEGLA